MADPVLLARGSISTEGHVVTVGLEHRVVAVPAVAAHRPDALPLDRALEDLVVPVRPGQHQRAAEARRPGLAARSTARARPRSGVIACTKSRPAGRLGPVGGMHARARRRARRPRSRNRRPAPAGRWPRAAACALIRALPTKVSSVSAGSGSPSAAADDHLDRIGREQRARSPRACRGCGSPPPAAARRTAGSRHRRPLRRDQLGRRPSRRGRAASRAAPRLKVAPSALPCTSISPRSPVITKFASVPAALSSA